MEGHIRIGAVLAVAAATAAAADTRCEVRIARCDAAPSTARSTVIEAADDAQACLARAAEHARRCATSEPVTASLVVDHAVTASATVGRPAYRCDVVASGADVRMGLTDSAGRRLFDLRIGSAGVVAAIHDADGRSLLAPSYAGERTDRVVQWSLWSKTLLHRLSDVPSEFHRNMFNVTQAGGFEDRPQTPRLHDTIAVDIDAARCAVDVWSDAFRQWSAGMEPHFTGRFPSLTRYRLTTDGALQVQNHVRLGRVWHDGAVAALGELRVDDWIPLARPMFDALTFAVDDLGAAAGCRDARIGYADTPVAASCSGFMVAYHAAAPLTGNAVSVVHGTADACNGDSCTAGGAARHSAADDVVPAAMQPCVRMPATCGADRRTLNVMDSQTDDAGPDAYLVVIPTTHLSGAPEGSLYVDEYYLVLRADGLSAELQQTSTRLAASVRPARLVHPAQAVDADLERIRTRLNQLAAAQGSGPGRPVR